MVSEKSLIFRGRLDRMAVTCPHCRQVWLAPGVTGGDRYVCKTCGAALVKAGAGASPKPPGAPGPSGGRSH